MADGSGWPLFLWYALVTAGFAIALLLMANVLARRGPAGSKFAWLLAIGLIPYLGVPLYLVFGGRKLRTRAADKDRRGPAAPHCQGSSLSRVLCAAGAPPPTDGNRLEMLPDGVRAFRAVIEAIEGAERTIFVSTLILSGDEVGCAIVEALERKARAGVKVYLLIDALFKFRSRRSSLQALRRAGGRVAFFMPIWRISLRSRANLRLHRKVVVVDDRVAIVGGMNFAQEYMGPEPSSERWRDLGALLIGPVVADIARVFRADWAFTSRETLGGFEPTATLASKAPSDAGTTIQVVPSGPDVESDLIYDTFLCGAFEARERLWICTPYFVPDEGLSRAVLLALRRGVEVRIVVPARSNHRLADLAGASHLREIAKAGGYVHCYAPGMLHGKAFLVDDAFAVLGSANMDMRSLFLNFEIAFLVSTRPEVDAVRAWIEALFPFCTELGGPGAATKLLESLARLFSPLE